MLDPPLPERVKKMVVTGARVVFNEKITLLYEPFIGTLGVSPEIEAISSLTADYYGGNMDLPDVLRSRSRPPPRSRSTLSRAG